MKKDIINVNYPSSVIIYGKREKKKKDKRSKELAFAFKGLYFFFFSPTFIKCDYCEN